MKQLHVIGVMSGTSLDGIDLAEVTFSYTDKWIYELHACHTYPYSNEWETRLRTAHTLSETDLDILNKEYTVYLGKIISEFIDTNNILHIDAVCSHGHTILHQPQNGFTLQIGNLPELTDYIKQSLICDFRVADVALGGQGAPLVPIGDQLLFSEYTFCMNLGGFANVSYQDKGQRMAYDICPVNVILNHYALLLGVSYDDNGNLAKQGNLNEKLLLELNQLPFYKQSAPKSLGIEWAHGTIFPIIEKYSLAPQDVLHTFVVHIAQTIAKSINASQKDCLVITGGGVYNAFLIAQLQRYTPVKVIIPDSKTIEYKEALIFAFLGVLKLNNKVNVLASVTGASKNHSAGNIFHYRNRTKITLS